MTDQINVTPTSVPVDKTFDNTGQELIYVTVDRLRLVLTEHKECVSEQRSLWAPVGIGVSILAALVTSSFNPIWGIPADNIQSFFVGCLFVCAWVAFSSIYKVGKGYLSGKRVGDIESVIEKLKPELPPNEKGK
ncbi:MULTISPECIES: hypothetical protein [unclassified Ruegeria]|uniref:hypothetical protein n=1 Tax=unclassified Ruegeria TaxID=2625375 RepID=UPI001269653B|nr:MULTISPECIES: hypothetical protein [unclassified Ruegeria]NOD47065.1 hypothetical protein [Ruegeria sp. HKCCD5849]NOD51388.1 hypothetical protein [Ruegeria sp. HKCCD5851]NOD68207.1 hypothetical protein [Ruegeria sp. HKCCD7303]QFT72355.1 hypothetical protein FIU92_04890 [Ruegeria sp. THAF33]